MALLFALVVAITLLFEPNFAASLAGESRSPWVVGEWVRTLRRLVETSPDLLIIPAIGLWLWLWTGRGAETGESRWAVLAIVLLGSSLVMSAKYGADLNYFLNLRVPESLAIGTLWHAGRMAKGGRRSASLSAAAARSRAAEPGLIEPILTGGDDYEILCTVAPERLDALRAEAAEAGISLTAIGTVTSGDGPPGFEMGDGAARVFAAGAFSHF